MVRILMLLVIVGIAIAYYYMYGKKHKKKEEEKPADGKKPEEKKPHGNEHHEPGFFTKLFWRTVAVVGGFIFLTICFPAGWQNLKDWGSSLIRSNTRSSTTRHPRNFTDQITVNDQGFIFIERYPDEAFWFKISRHGTIVRVTEMDGGNPQIYVHDGTSHEFQGARLYSFKAAKGTTAVITYTVSPRQ